MPTKFDRYLDVDKSAMALAALLAAVCMSAAAAFAPATAPPHGAARIGCLRSVRDRNGLAGRRVAGPRLRATRRVPCALRMAEGDAGGMTDDDMKALLARVSAVKDRVQTVPLCVLDATLPLQKLEFATDDTSFQALLEGCKERAGGSDLGRFGMLGAHALRPVPRSIHSPHPLLLCPPAPALTTRRRDAWPGATGVDRRNRVIMRQGTEVEILKADKQADGSMAVELLGTRCFQLVGDPWLQSQEAKGDPVPAPLEVVATATQGVPTFILGRVEYAQDADETGQLFSEAVEELSVETAQLLDDMVGEADMEANMQQSRGAFLRLFARACVRARAPCCPCALAHWVQRAKTSTLASHARTCTTLAPAHAHTHGRVTWPSARPHRSGRVRARAHTHTERE